MAPGGSRGNTHRAASREFFAQTAPSAAAGSRTCPVLSIGKLAAGQASYYLDQAEVRVDAVESIGDGVGEYYTRGAEARGSWLGVGAMQLGLSGDVAGDALRRVLAWLGPRDAL